MVSRAINKTEITGKAMFFYFIILMSFVVIFVLYKYIKLTSNQENTSKVYLQVINYTMPVYEVTSSDKTIGDSTYVLYKNEILNFIGLNSISPFDILKKEVACFNEDKVSTVNKESETEQPDTFKLKDTDITKSNNNDSKNSNGSSSNSQNSVVQVYDPKLKKSAASSKPEILIYHSHTTESYVPYGPDSMNPTQNVCAVGDEIAKELSENYGISVIHDKTIHNAAEYTKSYQRSGETVDKYLKQYGDFQMIIDIHRDSLNDKTPDTMKLNGESVAKFMFVMARKNPHYDKNISMVNSLIKISNKDFPGLCSGIYYYDYGMAFFNQNKSNNAFLLEIGCDKNDLTEAKATAKYLARIMAEELAAASK